MDPAPKLPFLEIHPDSLTLSIYVQPKSSKNMIVGSYGDALKIRLTAPPVDGAANKMCLDFLAKTLKVPKSGIEILSGMTGRNKRVKIKTDNEKTRFRIYRKLEKYCK